MMKTLFFIYIVLISSCGVKTSGTSSVISQNNNDFSIFFETFRESLNKNSNLSIWYPLNVECFADRSRGAELDEKEFYQRKEIIFPQRIIDKLNNVDSSNIEKKSSNYYVCAIGFSEWNSEIEMLDEYGTHYHFRKIQGKWYLVMISCVG